MKSYRDLEIYKESKKLAIEIHKMTLQLPKFELFEEGGQIRRSSKSVTAMIVEGYGRRSEEAQERDSSAPGHDRFLIIVRNYVSAQGDFL